MFKVNSNVQKEYTNYVVYIFSDQSYQEVIVKNKLLFQHFICLELIKDDLDFFRINNIEIIFISDKSSETGMEEIDSYPSLNDNACLKGIICNHSSNSIIPLYHKLKNKFFPARILDIQDDTYRLLLSNLPFKFIPQSEVLLFNGGIGDCFIVMPILLYALDKKTSKSISSTILLPEHKIIKQLVNQHFINLNAKFIDYNTDTTFILNITNDNVFKHRNMIVKQNTSITFFEDLCNQFADIGYIDTNDPQIILDHLYSIFPFHWKKQSNNKYKVAIQRISTSKELNKILKEWPISETRKFIKLCNENNIELINVGLNDSIQDEYKINMASNSYYDILSMLQTVDAFIGIDSSFGHACALVGTPSITLHISNDLRQKTYSYRVTPINMNFSIYTNENNISAEIVFEYLTKLLFEKICLRSVFIPLDQRLEHINFITVDE